MEKAYIYCLKFVLPYSNNATKVCIDVNVLSSNLIHLQNKLLLIAHCSHYNKVYTFSFFEY